MDRGTLYDALPAPMSVGCPCCYSSVIIAMFFAMSVVTTVGVGLVKRIFGIRGKSVVLDAISILAQGTIVLIASAFCLLLSSHSLREVMFFKFAMKALLPDKATDVPRCQHFAGISGRILEIGVGPGTNFRCWSNNTGITEWVGVEPNTNFLDALPAEITKRNITFPTRTVWLKGEDVDVQPESFDYVVGAHVLCSVQSASDVLKQVARALKPGGKYLFYEHVAAPTGTQPYYVQMAVQPFLYALGGGCQFKRLWEDVTNPRALPGFTFDLEHVSMNYGTMMAFLRPHIVGTATKLPATSSSSGPTGSVSSNPHAGSSTRPLV